MVAPHSPFYYIYRARENEAYSGFTEINPQKTAGHELHFLNLILEIITSFQLLSGIKKITKQWNFEDVYNFVKNKYGGGDVNE